MYLNRYGFLKVGHERKAPQKLNGHGYNNINNLLEKLKVVPFYCLLLN